MVPKSSSSEKTLATLREENERMVEVLEWIVRQKHLPRAYRHMKFEKLVEAAERGLGTFE
jgi:hypothetical protein